MSVFRLTDVSNRDRESQKYWEERVGKPKSYDEYMRAFFGDKKVFAMDRRNIRVLANLIHDRRECFGSCTVLEVACGNGRYADLFAWGELPRINKYVGIDFVKESIDDAKRRFSPPDYEFYVADMATFNINARFDIIFMVAAWSSIEQNSAEVIKNLKPMLSVEGVIAVFEENHYLVVER